MLDDFVPFHIPDIGEEEIAAVEAVLRSTWITTGPKVRRFESEFAQYLGVRRAVAVNSCTAALHLALEAIGIQEGDEVIVPTITFAATAEVVTYLRARPILVECDSETANLDPDEVAKAVTTRTKAVIPVHYAGQACDMASIGAIAERHHLKVVEDAAHAVPARFQGRMVGTFGDVAAFSFYSTKTLTTGEGGMAATGNDEYADRMRMMSLHGISSDAWKRYTAEGSWYYEITAPGFKYNMSDIQAALGLVQLSRADAMWKRRAQIAETYTRELRECPAIRPPVCLPNRQHAWHLYAIRLGLEELRIDRRQFIEELKLRNIGTSVHFIPLHRHPYYRDTYGYNAESFPRSEAYYACCISLPIYPGMTDGTVGRVVEAIWEIARQFRR